MTAPLGTAPAEDIAAAKRPWPRVRNKPCACGCGALVAGTFARGHNMQPVRSAPVPTCRVTVWSTHGLQVGTGICGQPLVTDLCAKHQADRVRLGGVA